ncbi:MAG TPA: hypothetical protein H9862_06940, partial [Candidatus Akkermansia intestinigallinarum]|nr:hypothetical protein [Candidatus Akkermansia intestinigallinarum]
MPEIKTLIADLSLQALAIKLAYFQSHVNLKQRSNVSAHTCALRQNKTHRRSSRERNAAMAFLWLLQMKSHHNYYIPLYMRGEE